MRHFQVTALDRPPRTFFYVCDDFIIALTAALDLQPISLQAAAKTNDRVTVELNVGLIRTGR